MTALSRRSILGTVSVVAGTTLLGMSTQAAESERESAAQPKQRIIVVGAHPDDPETGCGGTIARYVEAGHEVVVVYLTRGEAGVGGKSHEEAAKIRTAEAEEACRILGARPIFAGQIDGAAEVTNEAYDSFQKMMEAERPDVVFAHWPIDVHRDHRAASLLAFDAWNQLGRPCDLYFFEVYTGIQTQQFTPTDYVDIGGTEKRKRLATMAHVSQNPADLYVRHDLMNRSRGMERGCELAEAFIRHWQGPDNHRLP